MVRGRWCCWCYLHCWDVLHLAFIFNVRISQRREDLHINSLYIYIFHLWSIYFYIKHTVPQTRSFNRWSSDHHLSSSISKTHSLFFNYFFELTVLHSVCMCSCVPERACECVCACLYVSLSLCASNSVLLKQRTIKRQERGTAACTWTHVKFMLPTARALGSSPCLNSLQRRAGTCCSWNARDWGAPRSLVTSHPLGLSAPASFQLQNKRGNC